MWWRAYFVRYWWEPTDPDIPAGTPTGGGVPVQIWKPLPAVVWSPWPPSPVALWDHGMRQATVEWGRL